MEQEAEEAEEETIFKFQELLEQIELMEQTKKLQSTIELEKLAQTILPFDAFAEFKTMLEKGSISSVLPNWKPWWETPSIKITTSTTIKQPNSKIEIINEPDNTNNNNSDNVENNNSQAKFNTFVSKLPPFSSLCKSVSPLLLHNVSDLLYCYIMRLYNGSWETDVEDVQDIILSMSAILAGTKNAFDTVSAAVQSSLIHSFSSPLVNNPKSFSVAIVADVINVAKKRTSILRALYELHCIFNHFDDIEQPSQKKNQVTITEVTSKESRRKKKRKKHIQLCNRKIYFYICFCNELTSAEIFKLKQAIIQEHETQRKLFQQQAKKSREKHEKSVDVASIVKDSEKAKEYKMKEQNSKYEKEDVAINIITSNKPQTTKKLIEEL